MDSDDDEDEANDYMSGSDDSDIYHIEDEQMQE